MTTETADNRKLANELRMKAKAYRLVASVFALVGTIIFLFLYFRHVDGNIIGALKRPLLIPLLIIPFLPAVVLAKKADKSRKALIALLGKSGPAADASKAAAAPDSKT